MYPRESENVSLITETPALYICQDTGGWRLCVFACVTREANRGKMFFYSCPFCFLNCGLDSAHATHYDIITDFVPCKRMGGNPTVQNEIFIHRRVTARMPTV
jgi:hypothetical protein